MTRQILIEIGVDDSLPDVVRKCNDNFKRVSAQQSKSSRTSIRREGQRVDDEISGIIGKVMEIADDIRSEVAEAIDDTRRWVEERIAQAMSPKLLAPPVGTYLHCEKDPALTWPGTEWERIAEGLYLVSAGDTYKPGIRYGSNKVTLSATQIPRHTHAGPSHTHSGPSHTHSVSGTAADGGAHWHWLRNDNGYGLFSGGNLPPANSGQTNGPWWGAGFGGTEGWASTAGEHSHAVSGTAAASGTGQTGAAGDGATGVSGGGGAHENMPASIAVPLWKRTA